jgi:hypothetical protein
MINLNTNNSSKSYWERMVDTYGKTGARYELAQCKKSATRFLREYKKINKTIDEEKNPHYINELIKISDHLLKSYIDCKNKIENSVEELKKTTRKKGIGQ